MSNRPRKSQSGRKRVPDRTTSAARPSNAKQNKGSQRLWLAIGGLAIAAVIAVIAISALSGSDDTVAGPEVTFNGVALPALDDLANDPAIGLKAPLFVTEDFDGLGYVTGGGGGPNDTAKVYMFVAHWCPICQAEIPEVVDWLAANEMPEGVELVTVSTLPDSNRDNFPPSAWFSSAGWPQPVMVDSSDSEIAGLFGLTAVPAWVVVDDQNFVLGRSTGALGDAGLTPLIELAASSR